jgi:deoxycytidine triphosphate deaminase
MGKKTNNNNGSVLTIEEIKSLSIIQFDEGQEEDSKCYSNASYDLRLGVEYFIPYSPSNYCEVGKVNLNGNCPHKKNVLDDQIVNSKSDNYVIKIKPFSSIVVITYEKIKLPNNVAGRFDLRIQWALQGLILQVGTQIEPGYDGRLFGLIHNFSKNEICIPSEKSRFFTAEFYYTTKETIPIEKEGKADVPLVNLRDFLNKFSSISGSLENYLHQMQSMNHEFQQRIESEINKRKELLDDTLTLIQKQKSQIDDLLTKNIETSRFKENMRVAGVGILITIFIALPITIAVPLFVTKYTVDKDDYPFQKVYEMETENKKIYLKIDSLLEKDKQTSDTLILMRKRVNELEKKNGKK